MLLGPDPLDRALHADLPPTADTTADRAADLLAATSALPYLRTTRAAGTPEAQRLSERIQGLVAELIAAPERGRRLAVGAAPDCDRAGQTQPAGRPPATGSPRHRSSGRWPRPSRSGLLTDPKVLDKAVAYLTQRIRQGQRRDHGHARGPLARAEHPRRAATFETANSLNRVRQSLSDTALAYLALTFANLDRPTLAGEILGILTPGPRPSRPRPGRPARLYWDRVEPVGRSIARTRRDHRAGQPGLRPGPPAGRRARSAPSTGCSPTASATAGSPHKAKGPALAALAPYHGRAKGAEDRYRLTVTVNDTKVAELTVHGSTESQAIAVPREGSEGRRFQPRPLRHGRPRHASATP